MVIIHYSPDRPSDCRYMRETETLAVLKQKLTTFDKDILYFSFDCS